MGEVRRVPEWRAQSEMAQVVEGYGWFDRCPLALSPYLL